MVAHRKTAADARPAVGRDLDTWCTRCNLSLSHTIIAMVGLEIVRVKCATCGSEHKYRTEQEATAPKSPRSKQPSARSVATASAAASIASRNAWNRAMGERDRAKAIVYSPQIVATPGSLLSHKQFGYGVVDSVVEGKSRVLFEDGFKLLVTGR